MIQLKKKRTGTKKKAANPTFRHSSISCGKTEKKILTFLFNNQKERFSLRGFAKKYNIAKTTVQDNTDNLIRKKLVKRDEVGNKKITKKGINFMEACVRKPYGSLRCSVRKESLSTHYLKYHLTIKNKENYRESRLNELNPKRVKPNQLSNFKEMYVYFEDSTVVIKLNTIIIHIHDIISNNLEEAHFIAFQRALALTVSLRRIGLKTERMTLSQANYARVESYLSEKLSKIDNKYFLDLGDGEKFFIDYSEKREDETDSALYRERVDELFLDLKKSKSVMSDVDKAKDDLDKMKDISLNNIKAIQAFINLEQVKIGMGLEDNIPKEIKDKKLNNYFG